MFNRKIKIDVDLIDFSINDIGTGQIGGYIINYLYSQLGFRHIGYRIERTNCHPRCILYTMNPPDKFIVQYFKDRCSGMIEEKVKSMDGVSHKHEKWNNGLQQVCEYEQI